MLDLYQQALKFDTSGKRGFTYCSKKKEVWKVLKKKKEVLRLEKKTGEQKEQRAVRAGYD